MTMDEIIDLANNGDVEAIEFLCHDAVERNAYSEVGKWAEKGALAGSKYCLCLAPSILCLLAKAEIEALGGEGADESLDKLNKAEKFAYMLIKAGDKDQDANLINIYNGMTWSYYVRGLTDNAEHYHRKAIESFRKVKGHSPSKVVYAYICALYTLDQKAEAISLIPNLLENHDDTLNDTYFMALCSKISLAYLLGDCVSPSYKQAEHYALLAGTKDPNNEVTRLYRSDDAKKAFKAQHGTLNYYLNILFG